MIENDYTLLPYEALGIGISATGLTPLLVVIPIYVFVIAIKNLGKGTCEIVEAELSVNVDNQPHIDLARATSNLMDAATFRSKSGLDVIIEIQNSILLDGYSNIELILKYYNLTLDH